MRLLIDANIILDVLLKREPHYISSANILRLGETDGYRCFASTLTFANIVYITRKSLKPSQIENLLDKMALQIDFADLTAQDMRNAAELKWNDYEDALQEVIAERIPVDCIVTRNKSDFSNSKIDVFSPDELIEKILKQHKDKLFQDFDF